MAEEALLLTVTSEAVSRLKRPLAALASRTNVPALLLMVEPVTALISVAAVILLIFVALLRSAEYPAICTLSADTVAPFFMVTALPSSEVITPAASALPVAAVVFMLFPASSQAEFIPALTVPPSTSTAPPATTISSPESVPFTVALLPEVAVTTPFVTPLPASRRTTPFSPTAVIAAPVATSTVVPVNVMS